MICAHIWNIFVGRISKFPIIMLCFDSNTLVYQQYYLLGTPLMVLVYCFGLVLSYQLPKCRWELLLIRWSNSWKNKPWTLCFLISRFLFNFFTKMSEDMFVRISFFPMINQGHKWKLGVFRPILFYLVSWLMSPFSITNTFIPIKIENKRINSDIPILVIAFVWPTVWILPTQERMCMRLLHKQFSSVVFHCKGFFTCLVIIMK